MASDKARFYLEQYVPELQEYERKGVFTHDEITSIASKRNDFEHTLNARGSRPTDYARYATYEINLDTLRKKRSKRLGIKTTTFSGQRTIFFILDRAVKKFPGDMSLWMQYIHFCQRERANKKLAKAFTKVLRLKPRDWNLWVLAAKHYSEHQGDMVTARSYMQRGLRFCKDEPRLWIEYMRLEMVYLAKLAARRKILGLDEPVKEAAEADKDADMITLPTITAAEFEMEGGGQGGDMDVETETRLQQLNSTPALAGAIPMAVFDAAMKQFVNRMDIAEKLFEVVFAFDKIPSSRQILEHIQKHMQTVNAGSPEAIMCEVRLSMFGIEVDSADFPIILGQTLSTIKSLLARTEDDLYDRLVSETIVLLLPCLRKRDTMDEDVVTVLESSIRRYLSMLSSASTMKLKHDPAEVLVRQLQDDGREGDAALLETYRSGSALQALP